MKVGLILILIITGLTSKEKVTVDILSVDYNLETYARVKCSEFMDTFEKREIKKQRIRSDQQVGKIIDLIISLQSTESKRGVNTRAKLVIKYGNQTDTLCADNLLLTYKGAYFSMTDDLKKIIWGKN